MLEGHVLRELLSPDIRATQLFAYHEIFHGVTAPGFLFGAGFTFAIATQRKWQQAITFNESFLKRVWRAISLILVGYSLHFPYLSLSKTLEQATSTQWNAFLIFDVLQCIGLGLLTMRLLLFFLKREDIFIGSLLGLLLSIVYLTPLVWMKNTQNSLPLWFLSALNGLAGSPFPIFPYVGFLVAGTLVSWLFLRAAQEGREEFVVKRMILGGITLVLCGYVSDAFPVQTYPDYNFWNTSPNFFWIRLGMLLLMLGGLWYLEDFLARHSNIKIWMPQWLIILGVQSLFVYIAHLLILCGWVTNVELNLRWWGETNLILVSHF